MWGGTGNRPTKLDYTKSKKKKKNFCELVNERFKLIKKLEKINKQLIKIHKYEYPRH